MDSKNRRNPCHDLFSYVSFDFDSCDHGCFRMTLWKGTSECATTNCWEFITRAMTQENSSLRHGLKYLNLSRTSVHEIPWESRPCFAMIPRDSRCFPIGAYTLNTRWHFVVFALVFEINLEIPDISSGDRYSDVWLDTYICVYTEFL